MAAFEPAFEKLLTHEGGLVDHPNDPGGMTKYGISQRAYPWVDISKLTVEAAAALYARDYWMPMRGDDFCSQAVANKVFDMVVNTGSHGVRALQRALNYLLPDASELDIDGNVGPATLAAERRVFEGDDLEDANLLLLALRGYHFMHYENLVQHSLTTRYEAFAKGWLRRAFE